MHPFEIGRSYFPVDPLGDMGFCAFVARKHPRSHQRPFSRAPHLPKCGRWWLGRTCLLWLHSGFPTRSWDLFAWYNYSSVLGGKDDSVLFGFGWVRGFRSAFPVCFLPWPVGFKGTVGWSMLVVYGYCFILPYFQFLVLFSFIVRTLDIVLYCVLSKLVL